MRCRCLLKLTTEMSLYRQWSWPLWLPVQFFGIFPDSVLVDNDSAAPWAGELEQKLFSSAVGESPSCAAKIVSLTIGLKALPEY